MRVKVIACLAFAALLVFSPAASASLVRLTFPVIKPVYGDSGDAGNVMGFAGDVVKFSKDVGSSHGANLTAADFPKITGTVTSIPGPETLLAALGPQDKSARAARDSIYAALVGRNLTYSNIAGKPMNYTITRDDIKGINRTVYKNRPAWKVRVGEGLAWDITMDDSGKQVLDTKQLFQT